jgi:hypothetical protein
MIYFKKPMIVFLLGTPFFVFSMDNGIIQKELVEKNGKYIPFELFAPLAAEVKELRSGMNQIKADVKDLKLEFEELKRILLLSQQSQVIMQDDLREFIDLSKTLETVIMCQREDMQQQEETQEEKLPTQKQIYRKINS